METIGDTPIFHWKTHEKWEEGVKNHLEKNVAGVSLQNGWFSLHFTTPKKWWWFLLGKNPWVCWSSKPTKAQDSWSLNDRRLGEILVTWGVVGFVFFFQWIYQMTGCENHRFLIGDTSSNGWFFHCHVSFSGCIWLWHAKRKCAELLFEVPRNADAVNLNALISSGFWLYEAFWYASAIATDPSATCHGTDRSSSLCNEYPWLWIKVSCVTGFGLGLSSCKTMRNLCVQCARSTNFRVMCDYLWIFPDIHAIRKTHISKKYNACASTHLKGRGTVCARYHPVFSPIYQADGDQESKVELFVGRKRKHSCGIIEDDDIVLYTV